MEPLLIILGTILAIIMLIFIAPMIIETFVLLMMAVFVVAIECFQALIVILLLPIMLLEIAIMKVKGQNDYYDESETE